MGVPIRALAAGVGLCATLSAASARAEQFLLFDVEFTYTWHDAINSSPSMSHYYVNDDNVLNTERPSNWLTPVDFRNGTLHVRLEVIDRPSGDQTANWTLCYIANEGGYGCAQTGVYTSEGVFESDVDMTSWWNNDVIDWSQGIKQMDLIYKKSTAGLDHIHFFPELEPLLTPTTVRITMVQVAAGDTYDPNALGLDFGTGGAAGAGGAGNEAGAAGGGEGGNSLGGGSSNGGSAGESVSAGAAGMSGGMEAAGSAGVAGTVGEIPSPVTPPLASAGSTAALPTAMGGSASAATIPIASTETDSASGCTVQRRQASSPGLVSYLLVLAAMLIRRRSRNAA